MVWMGRVRLGVRGSWCMVRGGVGSTDMDHDYIV
jgi:hypothetical protein